MNQCSRQQKGHMSSSSFIGPQQNFSYNLTFTPSTNPIQNLPHLTHWLLNRWDHPPNSPNIPSKTKYYPHSLQGKFSTTSSPRIAFPMEIKLPYIKSSKPLPPRLKKKGKNSSTTTFTISVYTINYKW